MILYFSGTGNSQFVAKEMSKILKDEIVSINKCLKKGEKESFHTTSSLIFVVPTYSWQMPRVVENWIRETNFENNQKAYFILTCGGSVGNAATYARQLCEEKQLQFCGLALIAMPNNYVALSNTPNKQECQSIIEKAKEQIILLANVIQNQKSFPDLSISWKDKLYSGPVNKLFYSIFIHDKGFSVSHSCVSCGQCAKRCPLNNIKIIDGKPTWQGNCTHCMACIGGCPVEAIEYKKTSKGKRRYYIMEDENECDFNLP